MPGSLLIGIIVAVIAGIPLGVTHAPEGLIAPLDFSTFGAPFASTADGNMAIVKVLTDPMLLVVAFSLLMSDFFDTMGTAMAVAKQGEFLTEDGNVEDIRPILVVDSVAAAAGGFMASPPSPPSSSPPLALPTVAARASPLSPPACCSFSPRSSPPSSPSFPAPPPAVLCLRRLPHDERASEIDWSDVSQGFPAFMIVAGVPFTYSISAGIGLGFIAT